MGQGRDVVCGGGGGRGAFLASALLDGKMRGGDGGSDAARHLGHSPGDGLPLRHRHALWLRCLLCMGGGGGRRRRRQKGASYYYSRTGARNATVRFGHFTVLLSLFLLLHSLLLLCVFWVFPPISGASRKGPFKHGGGSRAVSTREAHTLLSREKDEECAGKAAYRHHPCSWLPHLVFVQNQKPLTVGSVPPGFPFPMQGSLR